jgi:hypothetical protein
MVVIKRDHINKLAIRWSCTTGPLLCHGGYVGSTPNKSIFGTNMAAVLLYFKSQKIGCNSRVGCLINTCD